MKKRFGIFWIETQRKIYGDDNYYTLGTLWGIVDTEEEAISEIKKINPYPNKKNLITIIPIYSI